MELYNETIKFINLSGCASIVIWIIDFPLLWPSVEGGLNIYLLLDGVYGVFSNIFWLCLVSLALLLIVANIVREWLFCVIRCIAPTKEPFLLVRTWPALAGILSDVAGTTFNQWCLACILYINCLSLWSKLAQNCNHFAVFVQYFAPGFSFVFNVWLSSLMIRCANDSFKILHFAKSRWYT
jgi:hypothetical protein